MKILLTTDTVGGVWTFTADLAGALARRGHEITLAAFGGLAGDEQTRQIAALPGVRLHSTAWKLEWMDEPWLEVDQSGAWLLDLAERLAPDLVHLNTLGHGALAWNVPTLLTVHSCVLSWWQAVKGTPAPPEWEPYRRRVNDSLHRVDAIVAPSAALLAEISGLYGPPPPAHVVPNGRDAADFPPGEKEDFVLATGRLWDAAKNTAALARVSPRLAWPVYAAGENLSPDGRSHDPGGLRLLGRLAAPELATWLGRAAIFAAPARYEPFGLGILEAALAGCALVLGDIESLREIWQDSALFVPPGDVDALYSALAGLIQNPAARAAQAARSRARALTYTVDQMTDGYIALYEQAIGTCRASGIR